MAICPQCKTTSDDLLSPCPQGDGFYCIDEAEFASNSDDPMLGRRIAGRFIISAVLGRGSMGKVYKAHQHQVDRDVALKVFRAETLMQHTLGRSGSIQERELARARFVQEAKVLGRLSHPNCVTVYDFGMGEGDDFMYMAMEFVAGISLRKAINRGLKFDAIVEIMRQILLALREAHSLGIVHRDLKPENIVLSYRFNTGEHVVKVLDFGIAKLLQSEEDRLTRAGALFGTPAYMSPEQCRGEVHTIGPQVDIYAMGCILYEMICGQLPYVSQFPQQMVRLHQEAEIPPLVPRRGVEVPEGLEAFVHTCLAKDHNDRFADADAAIKAFDRVLDAHLRQSGELNQSDLLAYDSITRTALARSGVARGARTVVVPEDHVSGDILDPIGKSGAALAPAAMAAPVVAEDLAAQADMSAPPRVSLPSNQARKTLVGANLEPLSDTEAARRTRLIVAATVAVLLCSALIFALFRYWLP